MGCVAASPPRRKTFRSRQSKPEDARIQVTNHRPRGVILRQKLEFFQLWEYAVIPRLLDFLSRGPSKIGECGTARTLPVTDRFQPSLQRRAQPNAGSLALRRHLPLLERSKDYLGSYRKSPLCSRSVPVQRDLRPCRPLHSGDCIITSQSPSQSTRLRSKSR